MFKAEPPRDLHSVLAGDFMLLPLLDADTYIIGIFRKPKRVVSSIESMGQGGKVNLQDLVQTYNERTLENIERFLRL